jgi:hypothetical protein
MNLDERWKQYEKERAKEKAFLTSYKESKKYGHYGQYTIPKNTFLVVDHKIEISEERFMEIFNDAWDQLKQEGIIDKAFDEIIEEIKNERID